MERHLLFLSMCSDENGGSCGRGNCLKAVHLSERSFAGRSQWRGGILIRHRSFVQASFFGSIVLLLLGCQPFKTVDERDSSSLGIPDVPATFVLQKNSLRVVSFEAKREKLNYIFSGLSTSDASAIESKKIELGAYDFSKGISPDLSWNKEKAEIWLGLLSPICQSGKFQSMYPFPSKADAFIEKAYGRSLNSDDIELKSIITSSLSNNTDRGTVLCLSVLASTEFLTQ